jgi:hypothetical protein
MSAQRRDKSRRSRLRARATGRQQAHGHSLPVSVQKNLISSVVAAEVKMPFEKWENLGVDAAIITPDAMPP